MQLTSMRIQILKQSLQEVPNRMAAQIARNHADAAARYHDAIGSGNGQVLLA